MVSFNHRGEELRRLHNRAVLQPGLWFSRTLTPILSVALIQLVIGSFSSAAKVDTVSVYSAAMDTSYPAIVVIPDDYFQTTELFPTVYLLHGYGGNYQNWIDHADLKSLSDDFDLILVCPDGGTNSWYLDSPIDSKSQYETYIARELVSWIDDHYRTKTERSGRAITGLSMGGHGALYLAIRHPDTYIAVGSMSGGVDLTYSTVKWEIAQKLGMYKQYPERWRENSVVNMIPQLVGLDLEIVIDCGVDDFFIEVNRNLHRKLLQLGIPHDYYERPGGHEWNYWTNALEFHLLFFKNVFESKN